METTEASKEEGIATDEAYSGILCEFLEVAIHLILYVREVYPPAMFQRRRKYNTPVHMCAHPELNQYIRNVVDGIRPLLEAGQVDHIAVLIKSKENAPVEKFVFSTGKGEASSLSSDPYLLGLEGDLRALLLKISVSDALLQPNPQDCTFTVQVCTSEAAAAAVEHEHQRKEFPWVPEVDKVSSVNEQNNVIPLKAISSELLKMRLHVEERNSNKKH